MGADADLESGPTEVDVQGPPDAEATAATLAAAEGLAFAGRVVDAISLLTESNRRDPSAAVERRLVRLRHDGFTTVPHPQGREEWPPPYPDLFAGEATVPEIAVEDLTPELVGAGILHHGCLLVRGVLSPDRVDHWVTYIERAFAASLSGYRGAPVEETEPWYVPFNPGLGYNLGWGRAFTIEGGGVWAADSPRVLFELTELFHSIGLDEVLTQYFGERPAISVEKCTLRQVPTTTGTDWHQDGAFLGDQIKTVNCWLTLTDCGVDAPGLDVVPLRLDEILETGTNGAQFDWSVGPGTVEQVCHSTEVVRPRFGAGDALLFDQRFLHRTAVDSAMTRDRFAIETWFFAPSSYPSDQVPILL